MSERNADLYKLARQKASPEIEQIVNETKGSHPIADLVTTARRESGVVLGMRALKGEPITRRDLNTISQDTVKAAGVLEILNEVRLRRTWRAK